MPENQPKREIIWNDDLTVTIYEEPEEIKHAPPPPEKKKTAKQKAKEAREAKEKAENETLLETAIENFVSEKHMRVVEMTYCRICLLSNCPVEPITIQFQIEGKEDGA